MAEMVATRKKAKVKKPKIVQQVISSVSDIEEFYSVKEDTKQKPIVQEIQSEVEKPIEVGTHKEVEIHDEDLHTEEIHNEDLHTEEIHNELIKIENKIDLNVNKEKIADEELPMKDNLIESHESVARNAVEIQKLYPSLTLSLLPSDVILVDSCNKNSLDIVTERVTQPVVPVEEWKLPEPMTMAQLRTFYQNDILADLERCQEDFSRQMRTAGNHPLTDLITAYQRSVTVLHGVEQKLRIIRDGARLKEPMLWDVSTRTERLEGKCRDNVIQSRSVTYEVASYNNNVARQLQVDLGHVTGAEGGSLDDQVMVKYECGLARGRVEDYVCQLVVGMSASGLPSVNMTGAGRLALAVVMRFLRQVPIHVDCTMALRRWASMLASTLVAIGNGYDRLYVLWELLQAPAGVGEWGASLVQCDGGSDLAMSMLAMLLGSRSARHEWLAAWSPLTSSGGGDDGGGNGGSWAIVDSDGEDDDSNGAGWALLRESDMLAFLNQLPLSSMFRVALDATGSNDRYEPSRGCHPGRLMSAMAFGERLITILTGGLDNYDNGRYKALNKRISRLIKHTIQFLTDHLEAVLGTSVLPQFDQLFPNDTRLRMLSQYEAIYQHSLVAILTHQRHGNWQCLTDMPWRLLSPQRKWRFLAILIDPDRLTSDIASPNSDWWLNNVQLAIDGAGQDDSIYLLTAMSNLAMETRSAIDSEQHLMATITSLIFQICYVIPRTRILFSKVGRELLSSMCMQHPQGISIILECMRLWHPTVGQMGLFLFRELPLCLLVPSDAEWRLLAQWINDNAPATVPNQLARHIISNLNWGFSTRSQTHLYLPLALHQRMATLLVSSFRRHSIDGRQGAPSLINETIKLVTSLWWNQDGLQDQSFHTWCLGMSIRLRLHHTTRFKVTDPLYLQPSSTMNSSDWIQAMSDAQQDRCTHPIAMYMAVTTWSYQDNQFVDNNMLKIIYNLVCRQQQYRMSLELLHQLIISSEQTRLWILLANEMFMAIIKQIIHADDTYYNMVKSLITKQFPGPVLTCIGNSFCTSIIMANGDKDRQEVLIRFFIQALTNQVNWFSDQSLLWVLDKVLEVNVALDLQVASDEMYSIVKQYTDKQIADASKRSGLAQMLRLGGSLTPLLNQLPTTDFMWLKSFVLEAQVKAEDNINLWNTVLHKLFMRKKRDPRSVNQAMSSACKHLRLGLSIGSTSLAIIQAVQLLAACPADHLALVKIAAAFFQRYLGLAQVWSQDLIGVGSAGHRIFQEDAFLPLLQQARTSISDAKKHHETQIDKLKQSNPVNVATLDQTTSLRDRLDMLLLWVDEPRLHMENMSVAGLPAQYRADLLNMARAANLSIDSLSFPRRAIIDQCRQGASLWETRHDLDERFLRLASSVLSKPMVPLATRLLQRLKRQLSSPALNAPPPPSPTDAISIPTRALTNSTQILEFASGPLSIMYQCAARHRANKNFLTDLDRKYLASLAKLFESHNVTQSVQAPCQRAVGCTGPATININHQTWTKRPDMVADTARNRQEYQQLVDEMISFSDLDSLVKGVMTVQHLITKIELQLQSCRSDEDFKRIVDFGFVLFFHLGRQINDETQKYPPHRAFVSQTMDLLGSKFMKYGSNQASVLLSGMLDNELLIDVYCPHFCPNTDTTQTPTMYVEVVTAYQNGKCPETSICTILTKFNMTKFMECLPTIVSKIAMSDALLTAISHLNVNGVSTQKPIDVQIEEIHINNLRTLLSASLSTCLPRVMDGFRTMCESGRLGARFWQLVTRCLQDNAAEHGELVLTIEEIRMELENMGVWLNKCRFLSDDLCRTHGLYIRFGLHSSPIVDICGWLLDCLVFKMARSANENVAQWQQVVEKLWDLFLKIYIPWIQAYFTADSPAHTSNNMRLPWRVDDNLLAQVVVEQAMARLKFILNSITNEEAQSFLLHCVLIWACNGLLLLKDLPVKPYHELYCQQIRTLHWVLLKPSVDCLKLIHELLSRPSISEQAKLMAIDITSQMKFVDAADDEFAAQLFDLFIAMICKTKFVFKIEAVEHLTDKFLEMNWNNLQIPVYRRGMDQVVACLEPRIVLCNQSTIEGKVFKFLNHAAGCLPSNGKCALNADLAIAKQTIYVGAIVKLLSIAFSFTQTRSSKASKSSADESQLKLFQLRVNGLFSDIEQVSTQVSNREACQQMAISLLTEAVQLFKNQSINDQAIHPVIEWLQESRSSPIILPLLITIHRCGLQMSSLVRLTQELIETYILCDQSNGDAGCWATINGCIRVDPELQQQYLKESVKQSCLLCLAQQLFVTLPKIDLLPHAEQWQGRLVDWLEQIRPEKSEQSIIVLIFLFLQLLLISIKTSVKPSSAFKNFILLLLKLSESKASSGFLGKVGLGKKSTFSIEFRMICRSLSVFLHAQLPSNSMLRMRPNELGAITNAEMTVPTRPMGEPLPTNKTMQNLEWLKSMLNHKEISGAAKSVLEKNILYICDPGHCTMDCVVFLRQMCKQLWPHSKLLAIIYA